MRPRRRSGDVHVSPADPGSEEVRRLLVAAERRAAQLGLWRLRLEVGRRQPAAIALYRRAGYRPIRCFSPYRPDAVCTFRGKVLRPAPRRRPAT